MGIKANDPNFVFLFPVLTYPDVRQAATFMVMYYDQSRTSIFSCVNNLLFKCRMASETIEANTQIIIFGWSRYGGMGISSKFVKNV